MKTGRLSAAGCVRSRPLPLASAHTATADPAGNVSASAFTHSSSSDVPSVVPTVPGPSPVTTPSAGLASRTISHTRDRSIKEENRIGGCDVRGESKNISIAPKARQGKKRARQSTRAQRRTARYDFRHFYGTLPPPCRNRHHRKKLILLRCDGVTRPHPICPAGDLEWTARPFLRQRS